MWINGYLNERNLRRCTCFCQCDDECRAPAKIVTIVAPGHATMVGADQTNKPTDLFVVLGQRTAVVRNSHAVYNVATLDHYGQGVTIAIQ